MLRRDRRAAERGQTLIFALAFLAFFGLVAASVLGFGSVVESQRASTERTAGRDSVAEGSAQFALGDTRSQACGTVSNGTLQFPSTIQADTLTYGSVGCQNSSGGGIAPGSACVLCLLNSSPPSAGRNVLTTERGLTVNGEVDANGSIAGGVTATGPSARIGLLKGADCGSCSPNATTLPTPFNDPLAGALPIPTNNQTAPQCNGCGVISPGVYSRVTVTHGTLWMKTGVYIVDGQLNVGGNGLLTNADASSDSTTDSDSGGTKDSGSGGPIDGGSGSNVTYTQRGRRLVDTTKSWARNQWAGAVVTVTLSNNTTETNTVASNTDNTMTMTSNWTTRPAAGDAYVVSTIGYTPNTLVDTSKEWATDQWAGSVVRVTLSNNTTETNIVSNNTDNTLSMNSAWGTTPSAGDAYVVSTIGYTSNPSSTLVDTSKDWTTDQWAGSVVTVTLSNNKTETNTVASNTDHTLTMSANWNPTPSPGDAYVVSTIGYTPKTLVDTSKTWATDQWAGAIVTVTLSSSKTETDTVVSNTVHTLRLSSNWGTTPSPGDAYSIVAPVVIYLACPTAGPYWSCATGGQSGGHMSVSGQGRFAVSAPTAGPYAGISLFADPNLVDPGGSTLNLSGDGGRFGGTVYVPRGSVDVSAGGGKGVTVTGRLIVQYLSISGDEGDPDSLGLSLPGTGPFGALTACEYYNDSLAGTEANGPRQPAHVQFETGCGSAGLSAQGGTTPTSIINFAYGP